MLPNLKVFPFLCLPRNWLSTTVRISLAGKVIHLYSYRTSIFNFLKYLMQRGETTSQAAGIHSASPWSAMPYQEHLRLLQTSYCCTAQHKAFGLGAGRKRALSVACIYPTKGTSHLVSPSQAWAVCSPKLVQTAQKGSVSISAQRYSSRCTYTSGPHALKDS